MSRNPYSQVLAPADTFELMLLTYDEVSECVAEEMVDRVVKVAVVELELPLLLLLLPLLLFPLFACTVVKLPLNASVEDEEELALLAGTETGTAVGVAAAGSMLNRSLLFSGSSADCELRLSTELQLMERVESSSA
ncbi:hypothetical protein KR038_006355 [Drosophila bunnanda]|nr:hypothetical protein KR038_006355 [Drosophila bunnanda]